MRRYRCFADGVWSKGQLVQFDEDQSRHLAKVLRVQPGYEIEILNGNGLVGSAEIVEIKSQKSVTVKVLTSEQKPKPSPNLHIACAMVKSSLWEDAFEQAIEMGLCEFTPLITDHTVVSWDEKKTEKKLERFERSARERLKQCEQAHLPKINQPQILEEFFKTCKNNHQDVWVMRERHEPASFSALENQFTVVIGPEGGWSEEEYQLFDKYSAKTLNFGSMILRTETAFVAVCATVLALGIKGV